MINTVKSAIKTSLQSAVSGKQVLLSHDGTWDGGKEQIAIEATTETFARDQTGKPFAFQVNAVITSATYLDDDENGSLLTALHSAVFNWVMSLSSLTITGYTFESVTEISETEVEILAEKLKAMSVNFSFIITKN